MESIDKQMTKLHINRNNCSSGAKKIPPAVPPKKNKAQPQVPTKSAIRQTYEPIYSANLNQPSFVTPLYSNYAGSNINKRAPFVDPNDSNNYSIVDDTIYGSHLRNDSYNSQYSEILPKPPNNNLYTNVPYYSNNPVGPQYTTVSNTKDPFVKSMDLLPPPLPPSPVSSNYSELARATNPHTYSNYQAHYHAYDGSQLSSNYESLYEPINPLPQNELSNNSVSLYANLSMNMDENPKKNVLSKEAEVDELTDLLVKSINEVQDPDVYGICVKCKEKVIGETSGCTAMNQVYHIKCFLCYCCHANLQGKPFYAVDGQPYCEADYLETLEKCSVCIKPIMDRILRATGKPYHPTCFTCVVCRKSLDGIPFTVDATNDIHCIEDFHKKFAPRCCVCKLPIMPEPGEEETVRVVALDRSFHVTCYRCEDCGMLLSSDKEERGCYPLDNHILCKNCNAQRIRKLTSVMTTDL